MDSRSLQYLALNYFLGRRRSNCFVLPFWVCEMVVCFWKLSMLVSLKYCRAFKIFLFREITLKILFAFPFHLTDKLVLFSRLFFLLSFFFYFVFFVLPLSSVSFHHLHISAESIFNVIFVSLQISCCKLLFLLHKA